MPEDVAGYKGLAEAREDLLRILSQKTPSSRPATPSSFRWRRWLNLWRHDKRRRLRGKRQRGSPVHRSHPPVRRGKLSRPHHGAGRWLAATARVALRPPPLCLGAEALPASL